MLSNRLPFLAWFKLHHTNPAEEASILTSSVVRMWAAIVKDKGSPETVLTFDSYYLRKADAAKINEDRVNYVAAVRREHFGDLVDSVKDKVTIPGQWAGVHNPETKETFVCYWDVDSAFSKKYVLSNAFTKHHSTQITHIVPLYDHYKVIFNVSDLFNKSMHDRFFPHRKGGKNISSDLGCIHNFTLTAVLLNVIHCHLDYSKEENIEYDFEE
eukprot:CAMPEP_0185034516 /NCGR_PEP_ID=MMETSP1103-20130426/24485_1 /TAXON_ID=36769 /ORGANISM="Paraphysomonas bandaiensis, Strain Caron Lab Isolate" /LENGTH=212 /DNA_ID=CAMNT_0027571205 /DNA_START=668 /DNA_END=1303 /DNA_ORIENTATION=+